MKIKDLKIGRQILISFTAMQFLVIVLSVVSYIQTDQMKSQMEIMYNHPFQVRKAIGNINADILSMRLGNRDLMLAKSALEKQTALQLMELSAIDVEKQFELINNQYLGDKKDVIDAQKAFRTWKIAREDNTKLALAGEIQKVKDSVLPTGFVGSYREDMLKKIKKLEDVANNKSVTLYESFNDLNDSLNIKLIFLVIAIIILSFLIGYNLLLQIRRPIEELKNVVSRFREGDMDVRSRLDSKNEFGILSTAFNSMVEKIQQTQNLSNKTSKLANVMMIEENAHEFFRKLLPALTEFTNSQLAAVYLLSDDKMYYEHFESCGLDDMARINFKADALEGEFGAAISSQKIQHIQNIPIDTVFVFQTVSGKFIPREIITIPFVVGKEVVAIISLSSIRAYKPETNLLLENTYHSLTARIEGVLAYRRMNSLLVERGIQQAELAKVNYYNRTLLEANIDSIVTIGEDGKLTDVNKSLENLTGLSRSELIGTDFANYFTEPERATQVYLQVFCDGSVRNYELAIKHVNGQITPVLYNATVYLDENGKVTGVFAAARDITQRKANELRLKELNEALTIRSEHLEASNSELEAQKTELASQSAELTEQNRELEMQKKMLNEASVLKTNFMSNMSHELRTPLNSVIALSGVLNRRLSDLIPEEEYSYLEVIERNGKHLLTLINDILDISRIESGREEIEIINFNPNNLINEIVVMLQLQANQKNVQLLHSQKDQEILVTSDLNKCRHILQNLIGNALKFTEKGKVEITLEEKADTVIVKVIDTGIGIDAKNIGHIFDEFRQADGSTSRRFGGTGLGLSIAKKYAALLGGTITVESELDKGSVFTLNLPKVYAEENKIIEKDTYSHFSKNIQSVPVKTVEGKTILLVDDSEPAIIQLKDFLEDSGYQILIAGNGAEALNIISQSVPDAMILDLMMPGIDGFEVLKTIRNEEATAHIPVLVLTAKHLTKEDLKELKRNNVHQLIQKGDVNRDEFMKALATMVYVEEEPVKKINRKIQPGVNKATVLVVEDNPDNMISIKALLSEDFSVLVAQDAEQGIRLAKDHLPNLILMDIALPNMDGIEAFKIIREDVDLDYIPVIALTASAMNTNRETIMAHGFDAYIAKPIDSEIFFDTINEVLFGE